MRCYKSQYVRKFKDIVLIEFIFVKRQHDQNNSRSKILFQSNLMLKTFYR